MERSPYLCEEGFCCWVKGFDLPSGLATCSGDSQEAPLGALTQEVSLATRGGYDVDFPLLLC